MQAPSNDEDLSTRINQLDGNISLTSSTSSLDLDNCDYPIPVLTGN